MPNLDHENLISLGNEQNQQEGQNRRKPKITIGEENLQKLLNGTRTCKNSKKMKLPLHYKEGDFNQIDENFDGTLTDKHKRKA